MTEQIGKVTLNLNHYGGEDLYSDGKVEDELLEIAKNYAQAEYQKVIEERASWPVLYHLSPLRENIVDWIPMKAGAKVLEIGSGCGAITGALSRKAGEVVCVDLSKKRSMINAYRHSGCDNVTIHVGNFKDIEPDLPADFDYIFLIGVFEYGQSYMGKEKPFEEFLSIVLKHLKKGGRAVIAIENKYGLKYFAGCKEDHLGTWFSGIENYADGGGVRTFSRNGLEKIFAACGVKKYHFYYPYPDYKFMTTLYSDAYLPGRGELSNNMRYFDRDRLLLFDERAAFDGIVEDALFSVFANSYEVIIGDDFDIKYTKYSNDRAPEYRIRTEIRRDKKGNAEVRKYPLCEEAKEHIREMPVAYQNLLARYQGGSLIINKCELCEENGKIWDSFEFLEGRLLSELLDECLEKEDMEGFCALFRQYVERTGYNPEFSVADFDLTFGNIVVQEEVWSVIDYEWTFGKAMDVKELAFRAVYCYLLEDKRRDKLDVSRILEELGITDAEAAYYREQEKDFQGFVTGKNKAMAEILGLLKRRAIQPISVPDRVQVYEDKGGGFSEQESYFAYEMYPNDHEVELELRVGGDVEVCRIDPSMESCVVRIEELTFNGKEVPLGNKKVFYTNGKPLKQTSGFVFSAKDPNLYVKTGSLARQKENILHVKMQVARLPESVAEDIAAAAKKLI